VNGRGARIGDQGRVNGFGHSAYGLASSHGGMCLFGTSISSRLTSIQRVISATLDGGVRKIPVSHHNNSGKCEIEVEGGLNVIEE
jgi:hypothetical protein